jgi:putative oxidoreductase
MYSAGTYGATQNNNPHPEGSMSNFTQTLHHPSVAGIAPEHVSGASKALVLAGRALFSAIFIASGFNHFSRETIGYAAQSGLPMAELLVPASGMIAIAGGLGILLGYRTKLAAWLIVLFLIPVTFTMHNFWAVEDPMMALMQRAMFMKNLSMLGGAFLITQFGAGPLSMDARRANRVATSAEASPPAREVERARKVS